MPYRCSYCDSVHCEQHRLPEAHMCPGKHEAEARARERRRSGHPGVEVEGSTFGNETSRSGSRRQFGGGGLLDRLEGQLTKYLLYAIVGVFILEVAVEPRLLTGFGPGEQANRLFNFLFVLDADWWTKPWTLVTSVFAHGGFGHLLFNGIILFFFGPLLERRIGSRKFLGLVLAGGILAGVAQVGFYSTFLGDARGVLGISGALMAVMGALTVLGPHIRVLIFFFIPAPLWAMMLGYAALDLAGFIGGGGGIAHLAHLTGLALGLAAGWRWRQQGYAFPKRRSRVQGGMRQGF
jgi:membrane associated rhomboid family serine protease